MFGHDSLPSRIYSYGAWAPTVGLESVREQMRAAHRYRNTLVEIERRRRTEVDAALVRLSPDLAGTEAALVQAEAALEAARRTLKAAQGAARKKIRPPALAAAVEEARGNRRSLYARRRELREALFGSEGWRAEEERIDGEDLAARKAARAASGIYWGSYLAVEQSMAKCRRGAPPKFLAWRGDGRLAVQIQGGLPVAELLAGADTRLRLVPVPPKPPGRARNPARWTTLSFRVGSDDSGGPVWAEVPVSLDRPLPPDAEVKWAYLMRRHVACHDEWQVCFVLARAAGWAKPDLAKTGTVGVDVGWRMRPDGSLRVAYWVADDGGEGEVALPPEWLRGRKKVEDLRSIRDKNFNAAREALVPWLRGWLAKTKTTLPDWLGEAERTLHQWRSPARLAALAIRWRSARFPGDSETFAALEAWRKNDKHLYEWERCQEQKLARRRMDLYRCAAAALRRRYRTAVIEEMDLRDFHVLPQAEEPVQDGALREHTRDAACSILVRCIRESMAETVSVDAARTTMTCAACGEVEDFDRAPLSHTCRRCGLDEDQDRRAARNLLASGASGGVAGALGGGARG